MEGPKYNGAILVLQHHLLAVQSRQSVKGLFKIAYIKFRLICKRFHNSVSYISIFRTHEAKLQGM